MYRVFIHTFLGKAPTWYKLTILLFLIINPILFFWCSPFVAGWVLLLEFIFTLALALQCYPIPAGGLLALEAVLIGLTTPDGVYKEVAANLPTLLLLIFMVAGIYYVKDLIFLIFTRVFIGIRKKYALSFMFCLISATLSAFLDALTLMAIIVAVCFNFSPSITGWPGRWFPKARNNPGKRLRNLKNFAGFCATLSCTAP